jgi:hypothetical protein
MTQPAPTQYGSAGELGIPDSAIANEALPESEPSRLEAGEQLRELLAWAREIRNEIGELKATLGHGKGPSAPVAPVNTPHAPSSPAAKHAAYRQMIARMKSLVATTLPRGATAAVISKGDDDLLAIDGLHAWHFPRLDNGLYAGHHPADGDAALAHLNVVRDKGAEFLVIPQTSFWWLDHYPKFRDHLLTVCRQIARQDDTCAIFQIRERSANEPRSSGGDAYRRLCAQLRDFAASLVPKKSRLAVISKGDPELVDFPGIEAEHFPKQEDGLYSGHHPADSNEAIAHLATFRANGGGFLLIPKPSLWWLDFYGGFREHLGSHARLVSRQRHLGVLYFLTANE